MIISLLDLALAHQLRAKSSHRPILALAEAAHDLREEPDGKGAVVA